MHEGQAGPMHGWCGVLPMVGAGIPVKVVGGIERGWM